MDETLILESIDDAIEGCEVHTWLPLFSDKLFSEIRKSDSWVFREKFNESFARFGDARVRHGFRD
jgi:hypothetical protein